MSLKARIKRLQAGAEWLRYDGEVLLYERLYEVLQAQKAYKRALERKERADALAAEAQARAKARAQALAEEEARREAVYAAQCAAASAPAVSQPETTGTPPPSPEPAPPPESHDIPEHMQIRPVHWRVRGPDDWEEECELPEVLHEYDPLEWDSS